MWHLKAPKLIEPRELYASLSSSVTLWKPELGKHFSSDRTSVRAGTACDCAFAFSPLLQVKGSGMGRRRQGSRTENSSVFRWVLKFSISTSGDLSGARSSPLPNSNTQFSVPWGLGSPSHRRPVCSSNPLPLHHLTWAQYCCCGACTLKM